eukprot:8759080-Pyramimonas_sp.AAC.1
MADSCSAVAPVAVAFPEGPEGPAPPTSSSRRCACRRARSSCKTSQNRGVRRGASEGGPAGRRQAQSGASLDRARLSVAPTRQRARNSGRCACTLACS